MISLNGNHHLLILAVSALLVSAPTSVRSEPFGKQLNPTGDPIGGGIGYRDIKSAAGAEFVVSTKSELVAAIAKAKSGSVIYVRDDAVIDMTGADDQKIPGGVTLASGRGRDGSLGGLIYSNTLSNGQLFMPLFGTGGKGVRITGLRIRGPFAEVGDQHFDQIKIANGIKADHEDLEVDNCEMWAWNKWAIDLAICGGAHIHHNYIHHTRRWGYGYGVWVRGGGMCVIEANLFDFCRHHIGSGSQATSSYEARYNISLYHDVQPSFDRHGSAKKAGHTTIIHHNEFRNSAYQAILLRGNPLGEARFHHNWFAHASRETAFNDSRAKMRERVHIHDNVYGGVSRKFHPKAIAKITPTSGKVPLTIQMDGSDSRDVEGGKITQYRWYIADTPDATGVQFHKAKANYTFNKPGRYLLELNATNEYGVPGVTRVPVIVQPKEPGYVLSAWVKNSYYGPLKDHIRAQILIDGKTIWEQDIEGDEGGWQHIVMNVDQWVNGKEKVELSFRLRADVAITDPTKQIIENYLYVDDVHLFGGNVKGGDFELGKRWTFVQGADVYVPAPSSEKRSPEPDEVWKYRQEPSVENGGFRIFIPHFWTGEARSGQFGFVIGSSNRQKIAKGSVCEVAQTLQIGKRP